MQRLQTGDNVIIINAAHVVLTGRKRDNKMYYNHTGFIGGIKERSAKSILEGRFPERVVEKAIERMIPRGPLGRPVETIEADRLERGGAAIGPHPGGHAVNAPGRQAVRDLTHDQVLLSRPHPAPFEPRAAGVM